MLLRPAGADSGSSENTLPAGLRPEGGTLGCLKGKGLCAGRNSLDEPFYAGSCATRFQLNTFSTSTNRIFR